MKFVDITKKHRTRNEFEIRVYGTDGGGDFPVHGAMRSGGRWILKSWAKDGKATRLGEDPYDLVEVPDPALMWLNLYEGGDVGIWPTKHQAVDACRFNLQVIHDNLCNWENGSLTNGGEHQLKLVCKDYDLVYPEKGTEQ